MSTRKAAGRSEETGGGKSLKARAIPFVPPWLLMLSVPAIGWVVHRVWGGQPVETPLVALAGLILFGALAAVTWGYAVYAGRHALIRWHTSTTAALVGVALILDLILGVPAGLLGAQLGLGSFLALSWNIRRFDVLRHKEGAEQQEDSLLEKLGLKGTKFGRPKQLGNRVEVPFSPAAGQTVKDVQSAVPGIESAAGVPAGRSRATVDPDDASKGTLTVMTEDVLRTTIPWPGPNAPGGCITEPLEVGLYETGAPMHEYIAGGTILVRNEPVEITNTNCGSMGITRAGKTQKDRIKYATAMTRRNAIVWWFDKVKAAQTVKPLMAGLDIAVLSDQTADHKAGLAALERVLNARVRALGKYDYEKWTPEAYDDPRLRMPYLIAHFEEADVLMDAATAQFTYLASKCLSAGIGVSISLQRASAKSMDTDIRFNIASWCCFGTGDAVSAGFALSDFVIDAGAHPENWKANKPGYFYHEGPGVDEELFPVVCRSYRARNADLEAAIAQWAPQRAAADPTTVAAGGEWYRRAKHIMANPDSSTSAAPSAAPSERSVTAVTSTNDDPFGPETADDAADDGEVTKESAAREVAAMASELRAEGAIPPPPDGADYSNIDPSRPIAPVTADPNQVSWDLKANAPTAEAAAEAFDQALRQIAGDLKLRRSDGSVVFTVAAFLERYPFRSRPWFSERLGAVADGTITVPPGLVLERTDRPGTYRVIQLETASAP